MFQMNFIQYQNAYELYIGSVVLLRHNAKVLALSKFALLGGKHHQDKTNDVVDIYHKFSCSESITNRMILLVVYHNLAVTEPICYPKREASNF